MVLLVLGGLTVWAVTGNDPPRLNADTVTLAKVLTTRDYAKLPFARQAEYMKVLEDRDDNDELDAALEAGTLTGEQCRAAILEAWLGQQLKRTEKFHSLPPGARGSATSASWWTATATRTSSATPRSRRCASPPGRRRRPPRLRDPKGRARGRSSTGAVRGRAAVRGPGVVSEAIPSR